MLEYGLVQPKFDYSLFTMNLDDGFLAVLVYVDDILIGSKSTTALDKFKLYLLDTFKLKELGDPKYFLGLVIAHSGAGIVLKQHKYVLDLQRIKNSTNQRRIMFWFIAAYTGN